ncbi:MAG: hypothetical protein F4087_16120 [Gemmatimonadetes bacterium]|nr:hypothetical protein [Gemmatimonadota bacterium]MYE94360.1 hypothetical protein [Gemmatimonadota bacterium]MYJ70018.1 hypothetical protein [Gemmatimonadota bacterium]
MLHRPHLLDVEFTEVFEVGDDVSERQFAIISSMAFAPDGRLAVVDRGEFAVTVYDLGGGETVRWGGEGDGPGEFSNDPVAVAISDDLTVAIRSFRRIDVSTLSGQLIGSHLLDTLTATAIAFDRAGKVVAQVGVPSVSVGNTGVSRDHIMRLSTREVLWSSEPLPPRQLFPLWPRHVLAAGIGRNRIVVGMSDEYSLAVLDATTGRVRGRIARTVPLRAPSEEFQDNYRQTLGDLAAGDDDPMLAEAVKQMSFPETFRVVAGVFAGPPGRAVWVRRGMGVGDSLAPPPEEMSDGVFRLYDLFDGDSYEYIGTIEVPENLELMAGDSERVAGVQTNELGVHSVRVLGIEISGPQY